MSPAIRNESIRKIKVKRSFKIHNNPNCMKGTQSTDTNLGNISDKGSLTNFKKDFPLLNILSKCVDLNPLKLKELFHISENELLRLYPVIRIPKETFINLRFSIEDVSLVGVSNINDYGI